MKKRSNVAEQAVSLCKKLKKCSKHELAFWLSISVSTANSVWSYIRSICIQGLLDTANEKCVYDSYTDTIYFEEKK